MAEAEFDFITDEWWMLANVLNFIMGVGSLTPPEAENLLLDYAQTGWFDDFQWYDSAERLVFGSQSSSGQDSARPVGPIPPRQWGKRDHRFGTEVCVEWPHSRVAHRWTEPAPSHTIGMVREELLAFGFPPDGYTMRLVRWRGVDVIAMAHHAGLITYEEKIALLRTAGYLPLEPVVKALPSDPPLEAPSTRAEPQGWQAERTLRFLRKHYSEGQTSRKQTYKDLCAEFAADPDVVAENKIRSRRDPSREVMAECRDYLGYID
jgi:hypothetical protein